MDWKLEIRDSKGILSTGTYPSEITALHGAMDIVSWNSRHGNKEMSFFISGPNSRFEYHAGGSK